MSEWGSLLVFFVTKAHRNDLNGLLYEKHLHVTLKTGYVSSQNLSGLFVDKMFLSKDYFGIFSWPSLPFRKLP